MARMLYRLRSVFVLVGIGSGIWLAIAIANPAIESRRALLPITLMLWVALALAIGYTLPQLPPSIGPGDGLRLRIKKRFSQGGYWLAILAILGLSAFALLQSFRAFNLVFD
jgi:hypothetical protein